MFYIYFKGLDFEARKQEEKSLSVLTSARLVVEVAVVSIQTQALLEPRLGVEHTLALGSTRHVTVLEAAQ